MKPKLLVFLLTLAAMLAALHPPQARADEEISFNFFHKNLAPYGEWIDAGGEYGLVWHPTGVSDDWAPYTDGYWAYTDSGWTWVSYEDFGGITYHYGRWVKLEDEGWCWVPDYDWGPAWVSWRHSDNYVGWAPLPPECHYQPDIGISTYVDASFDIGPGSFRFCRTEDFGAPIISEVLVPRERSVVIIRDTVNVTNITVNNFGVPFLGGPRFDIISARVSRPIPTLKLVRETNITNINNTFITNNNNGTRGPVLASMQRGNTLVVPAPVLTRPANLQAIRTQYHPTKVLQAARPEHGWAMVKAPEEKQALQAQFKKEANGATPQTRAKPFVASEIAAVPKTADPTAQVPVKARARENGTAVRGTPGANPETNPAEPGMKGGFVKPGQPASGANTAVNPGKTPGGAGGFVKPSPAEETVPGATPPVGSKGKSKGRPVSPVAPGVVPGTEPAAVPSATPAVVGKGKNKGRGVPPATPMAAPIEPGTANPAERPANAGRKGGFVPPGENPGGETPAGIPRTNQPAVSPNAIPAGQTDQPVRPGKNGRKTPAEPGMAADPGAAERAAAQREAAQAEKATAGRQAAEAAQNRAAAAAQQREAAQANQQRAAQQREAAVANQERAASAAQQRQAAQANQQRAAQQREAAMEQRAQREQAPAVQRPQPQPQVQRQAPQGGGGGAPGGGKKLTKEQMDALKRQQGQ